MTPWLPLIQWVATIISALICAVLVRERKLLEERIKEIKDSITDHRRDDVIRFDKLQAGIEKNQSEQVLLIERFRSTFITTERAIDLFDGARREREDLWTEVRRLQQRIEILR